jgi:hypothetical protein
MTKKIIQSEEFVKACKAATIKALAGKVKDEDVQNFLSHMPGKTSVSAGLKSIADQAEAKGETYTVAIYGYVKCIPTHLDHEFEANHWGIGLSAMASYGSMYTAYEGTDTWKWLFSETRGYHAQGIADGGGILQITWYNGKNVPIGQFNSAAGGIGVFEVGGKGRWKKK